MASRAASPLTACGSPPVDSDKLGYGGHHVREAFLIRSWFWMAENDLDRRLAGFHGVDRPAICSRVITTQGRLRRRYRKGIGFQVQKPLAVVVVTGMMLAPLVILIMLPVLISVFSCRRTPVLLVNAQVGVAE
jgi:hypothetical protein